MNIFPVFKLFCVCDSFLFFSFVGYFPTQLGQQILLYVPKPNCVSGPFLHHGRIGLLGEPGFA